MKRKLCLLVLALVLCVGLLPATASAAEDTYTYGVLTYDTNGISGSIRIIDCAPSATSVDIPGEIDGKPVKHIESEAFANCRSLTSVTIPDSVKYIESCAFMDCTGLTSITIPGSVISMNNSIFSGCTGLTSVTISEGVTSLGGYTFHDCTSLTSITIPSSMTSIGFSDFKNCSSLTSIALPAGLTSIGSGAFEGCDALTTISLDSKNTSYCTDSAGVLFNSAKTELIVAPRNISGYTIPNTVKTIDPYAFQNCKDLAAVTIPGSISSFGYSAFEGCTGLTGVTISEGVSSIGYDAFSGCTGLTSVTIPGSVSSIDGGAFEGCIGLTSVTISEGITSIGSGAFSGCTGLTSVTIPASVSTISDAPFYSCTSLTAIQVAADNANYCSVDGVLFNKDKTTLIQFPGGFSGSYVIPNGVTTLGSMSFWGCEKLTGVTLPGNITVWCSDVFCHCKSLSEVVMTSSVINVLYIHAFNNCPALTRLVLPNTITTISPTNTTGSGDLYLTEIQFTGDAPTKFYSSSFSGLTATVYYPVNNATWTEEVRQSYGGTITWVPWCVGQHSFTDYKSDNNATCTADGTKTAKCDNCAETDTVTDTGSKKDHSFTTKASSTLASAATCTAAATYYVQCDHCDAVSDKLTVSSGKAAGHSTTYTKANPATCTDDGTVAYWYCSRCEKYFSDAACTTELTSITDPKTGHSNVTRHDAVDPTYDAGGNVKYWYCNSCKKYFSDKGCTNELAVDKITLPPLDPAVTATLSADGELTITGTLSEYETTTNTLFLAVYQNGRMLCVQNISGEKQNDLRLVYSNMQGADTVKLFRLGSGLEPRFAACSISIT